MNDYLVVLNGIQYNNKQSCFSQSNEIFFFFFNTTTMIISFGVLNTIHFNNKQHRSSQNYLIQQ